MTTSPPAPPTTRSAVAALAWAFGVGALTFALDQASKIYVVETLNLRERLSMDISPIVNFRMAWNTGVNFGLLSGGDMTRYALVALSVVFTIAAMYFATRMRRQVQVIGLGLAAGGALGNAVDRLNWGAVADFLNVSCCGIRNPWSFNIADIAIFLGIGLAIVFAPKDTPAKPAA